MSGAGETIAVDVVRLAREALDLRPGPVPAETALERPGVTLHRYTRRGRGDQGRVHRREQDPHPSLEWGIGAALFARIGIRGVDLDSDRAREAGRALLRGSAPPEGEQT